MESEISASYFSPLREIAVTPNCPIDLHITTDYTIQIAWCTKNKSCGMGVCFFFFFFFRFTLEEDHNQGRAQLIQVLLIAVKCSLAM